MSRDLNIYFERRFGSREKRALRSLTRAQRQREREKLARSIYQFPMALSLSRPMDRSLVCFLFLPGEFFFPFFFLIFRSSVFSQVDRPPPPPSRRPMTCMIKRRNYFVAAAGFIVRSTGRRGAPFYRRHCWVFVPRANKYSWPAWPAALKCLAGRVDFYFFAETSARPLSERLAAGAR